MNGTALKILRMAINGTANIKEMQARLGISTSQIHAHVRELGSKGFVYKTGATVSLQKNAKAQLLRRISQKMSLASLLHGSSESVLCCLLRSSTIDEIVSRTGLSYTSVYRIVSELKAVGVVKRDGPGSKNGGKLSLSGSQDLINLANVLNIEREMGHAEAEIIYHDAARILKKCPKNRQTAGQSTAFSMFAEYGVAYDDPFDYYVQQKSPIDMHDIAIHAIVAARQAKNRAALLMTIIFYVHNRKLLDVIHLRKTALSCGVSDLWLDIESYVRRKKPTINTKMFLPWREFAEKAKLYGIDPAEFSMPAPAGPLFEEIGRHAARRLEVYLLGGENMRIKNLKPATWDCIMAVRRRADFDAVADILASKLGYTKLPDVEHTLEDERLCPDTILVHPDMPRVDISAHKILNGSILSDTMIRTADRLKYGDLTVGVIRNEHVFLLKAIAGREGDIDDMEILAKNPTGQPEEFEHGPFCWEMVWDEVVRQDAANPLSNLRRGVFEQISYLAEQRNVAPPILGKLRMGAVDHQICKTLRGGRLPLRDVVAHLAGGGITAKLIRNRIEALLRQGRITKSVIPAAATVAAAADTFLDSVFSKHGKITGHTVVVAAAIAGAATEVLGMVYSGQGRRATRDLNTVAISGSRTYFPYGDWRVERENVDNYLSWRFPVREPSDPADVNRFVDDLLRLGSKTIADIDGVIAVSTGILSGIDGGLPHRLRRVDAAALCLGMA